MKKNAKGYFRSTFSVDGKRYCVYGKTEKEAYQKEVKKRQEIGKGLLQRMDPTLNEYHELWEQARHGTVTGNTIRTQKRIYQVVSSIYIVSAKRKFGEIKIKRITIYDLRYVQSQLAIGRNSQTTNDYMAHIKHIFKDAVKERLLEYNPFDLLKNLKRTEEEARDTTHRALSIEEQTTFFSSPLTQKSSYYNLFRMAILTGMRSGEIGALKYKDIKNGFIHVERTITRDENGIHKIGDSAKTKAGKRTIPLTQEISSVIEDQKLINKIRKGSNIIDFDDTIFKAPEGGILKGDTADRDIRKICAKIGIEPFTMHAFRATFATRAIESNMNYKTLQEILGHSNFNITMSLYCHASEETKEKEMKNLHIVV